MDSSASKMILNWKILASKDKCTREQTIEEVGKK